MSPRHPAPGEACSGRIESDTLKDDDFGAIETKPITKALFVTLEFSSRSFSGNGTLAMACVRGLAAAGLELTVLSATPTEEKKHQKFGVENDDDENNKTVTDRVRQSRFHGASSLVEVPVPLSLWGTLDARSPWREFRDGAVEALMNSKIDLSSFDVVFAVDFSGVAAAEALLPPQGSASNPPLIYLNFRVFSRTADEEGGEREMIRRAEGRAVAVSAAATAALCDDDAAALSELAREVLEEEESDRIAFPAIDVVLPPLRREFEEMPPPDLEGGDEDEESEGDDDDETENETTSPCGGSEKENEERNGQQRRSRRSKKQRRRNLLLCCVRLSPEKEPLRFVAVVEALAESGAMRELGLVPALVGGGDSDYAREVRERLVAAVEKSIGGKQKKTKMSSLVEVEGGFVGANELASRFFDRTLLNFHPCLADAYGMSAVEAASRGAASVIHRGEGNRITVGASALLRPGHGESFALDLSLAPEVVAEQVASIARDEERLEEVARRASERARSWSERESGERLAEVARRVLENAKMK